MSIAELHKGVLLAPDEDERARGLDQLAAVEARHEAQPFTGEAARTLGRYMAEAKRGGLRLRVRDAIIAATAQAGELTVLTRDRGFECFDAELLLLGGGSEAGTSLP